MKKKLLIAFLVGMVFCLTGCGKVTLVCSQSSSYGDVELTSVFNGNRVNNMSIKFDMDLSKYSDTVIKTIGEKDYCSTFQSSMRQYAFVGCNQVVENKHMIVTTGIDISKISSSDLKGSPKQTKVEMEKQGYTCILK